jgi:hypothetical protein
MRKGETVKDPNAEEHREVEKYTIDLTKRAEDGSSTP